MKTKLMLLIFTLSFMVMAACAKDDGKNDPDPLPTWGGGSTEVIPEGDRYDIYTPEELAWVAEQVNAQDGADADAGNSFEGKTLRLMNSISLKGHEWHMIGNLGGGFDKDAVDVGYDKSKAFLGTFDGQGNIIKDIQIKDKAGIIGVGLFGLVGNGTEGATIKSLRMEGGSVEGAGFVGGIVGKGIGNKTDPNARITLLWLSVGSGLTVTGTPTTTHVNDKPVGGVAGSILSGDMKYSYNDGATVKGVQWVAGVVACLHSGVLAHSYNSGEVSGVTTVGGVTAHSIQEKDSTAIAKTFNVFNRGSVDGTGTQIGGVLAYHELGDITGSFNTADITGPGATTGQIVGFAQKSAVLNTTTPSIGINYYLEEVEDGVKVAVGSSTIDNSVVTVREPVKITQDGNDFAALLNQQAGGAGDLWVPGSGREVTLNHAKYLGEDPIK